MREELPDIVEREVAGLVSCNAAVPLPTVLHALLTRRNDHIPVPLLIFPRQRVFENSPSHSFEDLNPAIRVDGDAQVSERYLMLWGLNVKRRFNSYRYGRMKVLLRVSTPCDTTVY